MKKSCPHCGHDIGTVWHKQFVIQKLERGAGEIGLPIVGRLQVRRERLVMVYVCELTNLPFLVTIAKQE